MAITPFNADLNIIQKLNDRPNAIDGISPTQLKQKFDEAGNEIKEYINESLIPEVEQIQSEGNGALATHKTSGDHDSRYYTETESDAKYVTKTDLTDTRKLSASGDFTGSWHGISNPAQSDPGIAAVVELHTDQIAAIDVDYIRSPGYGITNGSSTAFALSLSPPLPALVGGVCVSAKFHSASGANPTLNVDGKGAKLLKKPNGNAASIASGGVYTWRYDGTHFILQGEGGEYGDAVATDVLATKTIGTDTGIVTGTIPVQTGHVTGQSISSSGTLLRIRPQLGYYPADTGNSIQIAEPNWVASNIPVGKTMFDRAGSLSSIVSIQRGIVTIPASAGTSTVGVDVPINFNGTLQVASVSLTNQGSSALPGYALANVEIQTNNILRITKVSESVSRTYAWEVITYNPLIVNRVLKASFSAAASDTTFTLPWTVDVNKTAIVYSLRSSNPSVSSFVGGYVYLLNSTTLGVSTIGNTSFNVQLVEYK